MSKIKIKIPPQNFEYARNRVAEILIDEVGAQINMPDSDLPPKIGVYVERTTPFNITELPAYNVYMDSGSWDNKHYGGADGSYVIVIDAIASSKASIDEMADKLSAIKAQRMLGVARYILEDPIYNTLGFEPGFIENTWCSEFETGKEKSVDTDDVQIARLKFNVKASETNCLLIPKLIDGYDTTVKIGLTDSGYKYSGDTYR